MNLIFIKKLIRLTAELTSWRCSWSTVDKIKRFSWWFQQIKHLMMFSMDYHRSMHYSRNPNICLTSKVVCVFIWGEKKTKISIQIHQPSFNFCLLFFIQVRVYPLAQCEHGADDVLVLGSDGLWDVVSNQEAAEAVTSFLANCDPDDRHRHVPLVA